VKIKIRKIFLELILLYATTFPTTGLINEIKDYTQSPEDMDEHMFI